jgi:hypothetical protein
MFENIILGIVFYLSVPFSSPSAAASIIRGASTNGPKEWKVKGTEQTYAEWKDRSEKRAEKRPSSAN